LHPFLLNLVLPLIFDYQPKHTFVLDKNLFAQTLATIPYLFSGGLCGMVYEHISKCFIPEDPSSGFSHVVAIVVRMDIFRLMAIMLRVNKLLAMAKDISGLCPIVISEVFLHFISHSIVLQLWGPF
jgi:hypothetical protein